MHSFNFTRDLILLICIPREIYKMTLNPSRISQVNHFLTIVSSMSSIGHVEVPLPMISRECSCCFYYWKKFYWTHLQL